MTALKNGYVCIMIIIIIIIMNAGIYNDTAAEVLKERVARSYRGLEHIMSGCWRMP